MKLLKVAHYDQLKVDLGGKTIPFAVSNLNGTKVPIHIEDIRAGRLNLSLFKNHNGVMLLRVLNKPYNNIVYCVNVRSHIKGAFRGRRQ